MPAGGLFIAGGVAPKLRPRLEEVLVVSYLQDDKLMGDLVAQYPLYLVVNDDLGLMGALVRAKMLANS